MSALVDFVLSMIPLAIGLAVLAGVRALFGESVANGALVVLACIFLDRTLRRIRKLEYEVARLRQAAGFEEMTSEEVDARDAA